MSVYPFEIFIPQATLDDLRNRLAHPRWPDEVAGAGWDYGANLAYLKELVDYWQHDFDWRQQETAINRFEHFGRRLMGSVSISSMPVARAATRCTAAAAWLAQFILPDAEADPLADRPGQPRRGCCRFF